MFQWTLISPEERDICTGWLPDLIHTSCRSESSNISLVVLDKDTNMRGATRNKFIVLVLSRPLILTIINCVWKKIKFETSTLENVFEALPQSLDFTSGNI